MENLWTKDSWRKFPILQQPDWPDKVYLSSILFKLSKLPALVFSGETRRLKQDLSGISNNESFILQIGDCSESFNDCNGPKIHNFLRIVLQMAMVLEIQSGEKIIKIGRIAGQYAKPRSSDREVVNGINIPAYRGDNVNCFEPIQEGRAPDPGRLLEGYFRSAATLNLIRAFTQGGYGDIRNIMDWKEHFFSHEVSNLANYRKFEENLNQLLIDRQSFLNKLPSGEIIYISHEALLLDYEEAFARVDTTTGDYYSTSAHNLWIGDRTRQADGAHIEFARGIGNPIGLKIGPSYDLNEVLLTIRKLNPSNEEGKIILINRHGIKQIKDKIRPLIQAIKANDLHVVWSCDPMHGNTFSHNGIKVRSLSDIVEEIKSFFTICRDENVIPGGVHLEITGEYVSECIGGVNGLKLSNLQDNYVTRVDPRLNAAQALEVAFIIGNLLK